MLEYICFDNNMRTGVNLVTNTAPAQPHATGEALYPAFASSIFPTFSLRRRSGKKSRKSG